MYCLPRSEQKFLIKGVGEPLIEKPSTIVENAEYLLVKKQDLDSIKKDIKNLYEIVQKLIDK